MRKDLCCPPQTRDQVEGGPASISRSSGFTLMELLVVFSVILLITLIAIPNLSSMKIQANENSAIASVRAIYQAEVQYQAKYPTEGFACSLDALGGSASEGVPTPEHAQVLERDLADGRKSGYAFTISNCTQGSTANPRQHTGFEITAVPAVTGKTGHRGFCEDTTGMPKADPAGATHCTQSLQ